MHKHCQVQVKTGDHSIRCAWWSEPMGQEMIYIDKNSLEYITVDLYIAAPLPSSTEVVKRGRASDTALIFSSRHILR